MVKARTSRKQLFRAALAIAGTTAAEWAEQNGYSTGHLSRVLNGKVTSSADLAALMDRFIAAHVGQHGAKQVA